MQDCHRRHRPIIVDEHWRRSWIAEFADALDVRKHENDDDLDSEDAGSEKRVRFVAVAD